MDEQNAPTLNDVADEVEENGGQGAIEAALALLKAQGYTVATANGKRVKAQPPQSVLDRVETIAALMPALHRLYSNLATEVAEVIAVDGGKWKDQLPQDLRPLRHTDGGVLGNLRSAIAQSMSHPCRFGGERVAENMVGKIDSTRYDGVDYIQGLDPLSKAQNALRDLQEEKAGLAEDDPLQDYYSAQVRHVRQKRDELSKNGKPIPQLRQRDNPANATTQEAKTE